MLAYGPKYVPKCQSHFPSSTLFPSIQRIIEREYQMMSKIIRNSLTDNCVSASNEKANLFFMSLKDFLAKFYTTNLPCLLFHPALRIRSSYDEWTRAKSFILNPMMLIKKKL